MKILVLNGSPRKTGTVATLLKAITDGVAATYQVEWIDVNDLKLKPCTGCMKCRQTGQCILPADDAHSIGEEIKQADGLIVGTPVYWGNMSGYLKMLFERNVPVFMGESNRGLPVPLQKGKKAVIVTACTTPWPFNFIAAESRGAIAALREILGYSGYKVMGQLVKPGTKINSTLSERLIGKARKLGQRF
jgi:multimeric flavodoxin WrbA